MRSDLDKEISRLQKNARNKLYRLRKKGAINAVIGADFNPVVPAASLKTMSTADKRQYAAKLRKFNHKDNAYKLVSGVENVIQPGGTPISATELWEKRLQEAEINVQRATNLSKLASIREDVVNQMPVEGITHLEIAEIPFASATDDGRFASITPRVRTEDYKPGRTVTYGKQLEYATEALDENRLSRYQEALVQRMMENDCDPSLVMRVRSLTPKEMAYLHYYTDFSAIANTWQYEKEYARGYYQPSESESAQAQSQVSALLDMIGR